MTYIEYDEGICQLNCSDDRNKPTHKPAVFSDNSDLTLRYYISVLSTDTVLCVRCLSWPPQAAAWPTRHRNHCWPDSTTLDRVVNNGCDVVGVAHRQCIDKMNRWACFSTDCHSHEQKLYC